MSNVVQFDADNRPHSKKLNDEINRLITEIAVDNMTPFEVLGVLDSISKEFYECNLGGASE